MSELVVTTGITASYRAHTVYELVIYIVRVRSTVRLSPHCRLHDAPNQTRHKSRISGPQTVSVITANIGT